MRTITIAQRATRALATAILFSLTAPLLADDRAGGYRLLELDGYKVKWGDQKLGVGASISYAFAEETMQFGDAQNCGDLAPMKALAGQSLPLEILERETAAAFEAWERAANLSFHRVHDAREADIVIGAQGKPIGWAFANVAYSSDSQEALDPPARVRTIEQALVCLNPERRWKVGFDGDTDVYDIRYTLIHEIGHAIGLDHPGPEGQIMGFRYTEAFAGLQPGDLRGVRQLYGPSANGSELADTDSGTQLMDQLSEVPTADDAGEAPPSLSIN